jgi:hypothetical protein
LRENETIIFSGVVRSAKGFLVFDDSYSLPQDRQEGSMATVNKNADFSNCPYTQSEKILSV